MRYINQVSFVLLLIAWLGVRPLYAQSDYLMASDSVLMDLADEELDTLGLFQLLDSLIELESLRSSQFSLHLGYISEVSNAGRTLDVKQYGFNPGISYFHKSGLYGDVTGYWNSDLDPHYDLTVVSLGYVGHLISKIDLYNFIRSQFFHRSGTRFGFTRLGG